MSDVKPLSEEEERTYRWWTADGIEAEETARIFATLDAARRELSAERTRRERAEEYANAAEAVRHARNERWSVISGDHISRDDAILADAAVDEAIDVMDAARAAWLATRTPTEPHAH